MGRPFPAVHGTERRYPNLDGVAGYPIPQNLQQISHGTGGVFAGGILAGRGAHVFHPAFGGNAGFGHGIHASRAFR